MSYETHDNTDDRTDTASRNDSRWSLIIARFRKNRLSLIGLGMIALLVICAIFAPIIAPYSPIAQDSIPLLQPLSNGHLLGTDHLGRDIFSRIVYGTRYALLIGLSSVALSAIIGVSLGMLGGYLGGWTDKIVMRLVDIFLGIPVLVLAMAIAGILGGGIRNIIIAVGIAGWARFARLIRGETISIKENAYIEAARSSGTSSLRTLTRHVLPNAMGPIIVYGSLDIASAILWSASLSFLGLGAQPPTPVWGAMIGSGREYLTIAWWLATLPGLAIMITVLAFNFLGDGIRDALDPKLQ